MVHLPRSLARFNKRVTNRVQGVWAWLLPPWAVIIHRGRSSGREYRTPVLAWAWRGRLTVWPLYGLESDWVRNVQAAGEAEVQRLGRRHALTSPRLEPSKVTGQVLVADIGPHR